MSLRVTFSIFVSVIEAWMQPQRHSKIIPGTLYNNVQDQMSAKTSEHN